VTAFYLIVHADGKLHGGTFVRGAAFDRAELARGVVLEVPVVADFRNGPAPSAFAADVDAVALEMHHDEHAATTDDPGRAGEG
jgi:hypothetical protein